ncbi:hypothetical protein FVF58_23450 [Paraburkholderia panacisoli]|jgi:hypothetical protein|uniref:Uncharacterized protein n=1 Tax=Paraburkholderia panacisoli TaxID=2603818 RepID=A0A5B0GY35_9BURK|nr:hypothetical protein [Paraburkholderia panacisoli]KAA1007680.1 hypothetical protein FVF58_23450 [Paraburkholderia panacisoli]
MNRALTCKEAEAAILARMAASRVALLEANSTPTDVSVARRQIRLPAASFVGAMTQAPRVTAVLALCVGAIILGPRRTVAIASRSGIAAWVGSSVRKLFTRPGERVVVDK